jgi:glycosyltransferase involved in cell wall biosynthesis
MESAQGIMGRMQPKNEPLVTVGIPVFNGENYLPKVLALILNQDYANIEVLFADNNSRDNSRGMIQDFTRQYKNVRLISSEVNKGALANINSLFANAQGKYMLLAGLDDAWSKDFISNSVKAMEVSPNASLCIPKVKMCLGPKGATVYSIELDESYFLGAKFRRFWRTLTSFPSAGWYGLYRMSVVRSVGPIPISFAGDLIFLQKLSLVSDFIYCSTSILTFEMREKWNSRKIDTSFFYGTEEKPLSHRPFLIVLQTQFFEILRMKLHWFYKICAFTLIFLDLSLKKTLALIILVIKLSPLTKISKMGMLRRIHMLLVKPSWVTIESLDTFLKKEVYDRYGV